MKTILIFFLLGLAISYDREGAAKYAQKYCNNYNPNYNRYKNITEESANFVSQCLSVGGGQDFEGCEGRDNKGMFKNSADLKKCLISKGWKKTHVPQKGNPAFTRLGINTMILSGDQMDLKTLIYCSHTPDRCNAKVGHSHLEIYSLAN